MKKYSVLYEDERHFYEESYDNEKQNAEEMKEEVFENVRIVKSEGERSGNDKTMIVVTV